MDCKGCPDKSNVNSTSTIFPSVLSESEESEKREIANTLIALSESGVVTVNNKSKNRTKWIRTSNGRLKRQD